MPDLLVASKYWSNKYDCRLFLKPEWYGPTKSHKDKWARAAAKLAKQKGAKRVVAMSAGNQGLALAYACQKEKIECKVCVEAIIDPMYLELYKKYGASVYIAATEPEQYSAFEQYVEQGYFPLGITHTQRERGEDLIAVDAYRQTAVEILAGLGGLCPDVIIFPTSYADHSQGALREFIDLKAQGKIDTIPRFILARAGLQTGGTAKSIATDTTTKYVEDVIARSNGQSVFVTNDEMRTAKAELLTHHDWSVELTSAASVACLSKLEPDVLRHKTVVVILTASEDK